MVEIRVPYVDYPDDSSLECKDESLTHQSFAPECDYNMVLNKWAAAGGGQLPGLNNAPAQYGDFSQVGDYQTALNVVLEAETLFGNLPSSVRDRFNNDPQELLAFVSDEKNREEAKTLGLLSVDNPERPQEAGVGLSTEAPQAPSAGPAAAA